MLFSRCNVLAWAGLLAASCLASPVEVIAVKRPQHDLMFREALEMTHQPHLEKRLKADFSMEKTWKNEVLFAGAWINSDANIGTTDSVSLSVTCIDCWTKGKVSTKLAENILDPSVRLDFTGVEAYVDLGVAVSAGATYAVNLFMSNSPLGLGFPGLSVGVVFYVDLVFSLSSAIDLEGGFYVKVADGAFMEASIFGGEITESFFEGLSSKPLPVTVKSGSATFKADLRLRVQCGASADIDLIGLGAGAELGIYANLIEYVAVLESTPTCALQCRQWWDLNVGAYARLDVVIDYKTLGAVPTVSTTLLTAPTLTQCWLSRSPSAESAGLGATSAGASAGAPSVVVSSYASYVSTTGMSMATPEATTLSVSLSASTSASSASASSVSSHYLLSNSTASSTVESANVVTSTAYTTTVYTITSCAVTVPNCPASFQSEIVVTKTVDLNTASTATGTSLSSSSTAAAEKGAAAVVTIITDVIVLVPCATPVVETFIEPTSRSSSSSSSSSTFTAAGLAASSSAAGGALAPTSTALAPPVIAHGWLNTNATSLTAASVSSTGAGDYSRPTTAPIQTAGAAGTAGASGEVLALFAAGAGALLLLL